MPNRIFLHQKPQRQKHLLQRQLYQKCLQINLQQCFSASYVIRINRKYINLINSYMNHRKNVKQFTVVRYEPNNILLYHKNSKKTFQYLQSYADAPIHTQITHSALLRPIIYNNGLLYLRGLSNLETELQNRRRGHNMVSFNEEEIMNTFIPLIECLMFLHKNGIVHGGITPARIMITDQQEIKLKDWMIAHKDNIYYGCKKQEQITKEDDFVAMAKIITQAATLKKEIKCQQEKDINSILTILAEKYSKGFIFGLTVLLKKNKQRFGEILNYFNNQQKYLADLQLNSFYNSLKKQQQKKKQLAVSNQNKIPIITLPLKQILSLAQSPIKKNTPNSSLNNTTKRTKEDENKKIFNEEIKKKQIDKINKIIQRSSQFVNELLARKNNEQILKKIAPKSNLAGNITVYQPKKVLKQSILLSPVKRIRTSSKMK